jgi:hypothetical protein
MQSTDCWQCLWAIVSLFIHVISRVLEEIWVLGSWDPGILGSRGPGSGVWSSVHATYLPGVLVLGSRSRVSGSQIRGSGVPRSWIWGLVICPCNISTGGLGVWSPIWGLGVPDLVDLGSPGLRSRVSGSSDPGIWGPGTSDHATYLP